MKNIHTSKSKVKLNMKKMIGRVTKFKVIAYVVQVEEWTFETNSIFVL